MFSFFFFFNDTATTEIYTLSLHDALPIWGACKWTALYTPRLRRPRGSAEQIACPGSRIRRTPSPHREPARAARSEEHTSELQSRQYLVCRLLLEKKKNTHNP